MPLAHKDMYYKAGKRSTCGSAIRKDFRPTYTATVIERLEAAGIRVVERIDEIPTVVKEKLGVTA